MNTPKYLNQILDTLESVLTCLEILDEARPDGHYCITNDVKEHIEQLKELINE